MNEYNKYKGSQWSLSEMEAGWLVAEVFAWIGTRFISVDICVLSVKFVLCAGETRLAGSYTETMKRRRRKYSGGCPTPAGTTKQWRPWISRRTVRLSCIPEYTCTIWRPFIREIWQVYSIVWRKVDKKYYASEQVETKGKCTFFLSIYYGNWLT